MESVLEFPHNGVFHSWKKKYHPSKISGFILVKLTLAVHKTKTKPCFFLCSQSQDVHNIWNSNDLEYQTQLLYIELLIYTVLRRKFILFPAMIYVWWSVKMIGDFN